MVLLWVYVIIGAAFVAYMVYRAWLRLPHKSRRQNTASEIGVWDTWDTVPDASLHPLVQASIVQKQSFPFASALLRLIGIGAVSVEEGRVWHPTSEEDADALWLGEQQVAGVPEAIEILAQLEQRESYSLAEDLLITRQMDAEDCENTLDAMTLEFVFGSGEEARQQVWLGELKSRCGARVISKAFNETRWQDEYMLQLEEAHYWNDQGVRNPVVDAQNALRAYLIIGALLALFVVEVETGLGIEHFLLIPIVWMSTYALSTYVLEQLEAPGSETGYGTLIHTRLDALARWVKLQSIADLVKLPDDQFADILICLRSNKDAASKLREAAAEAPEGSRKAQVALWLQKRVV